VAQGDGGRRVLRALRGGIRGAAEQGMLASRACGESALVISHLEQGRRSLPCSKCETTRPEWYAHIWGEDEEWPG
jgi:hypothetical protein